MNDEELWKKYTQSVKPASWAKKPVFPELQQEYIKEPHVTETRAILKSVQNSYTSLPKKNSHHENKNAEKNLAKQMRRGLFQYQAKIDLHGYSQDQAYDALYDFFERNYRAQKRYLLVITGKGKFCYDTYRNKGILKPKLPLWFYDSLFAKYISVYHKAAPCHGGDGAYYVVLKKQK